MKHLRAETLIAGLGCVLVVSIVFSLIDDDATGPTEPSPSASPTEPRVTYFDDEAGFSITYPAHWFRAAESLTPHLEEPSEIFSAGTFELKRGSGRCAQFAGNAMEHMTSSDALVSIQESSAPLEAVPLESDWTLASGYETEASDCLTNPPRLDDRLIALESNGRYVYAFFAIGREATDEVRDQLVETVRSLKLSR